MHTWWRCYLHSQDTAVHWNLAPPLREIINQFWKKNMNKRTKNIHLSRHLTKSTKWPVRPVKTQISLGIHPVWSVFAVHSMSSQGTKVSSCGQQRHWSDWAADWSKSLLGTQVILLVLSCCGSHQERLFPYYHFGFQIFLQVDFD